METDNYSSFPFMLNTIIHETGHKFFTGSKTNFLDLTNEAIDNSHWSYPEKVIQIKVVT